MRAIDLLFSEYAVSHQNPTNKKIHWVCVPLIFWSILGLVSLIPASGILIPYIGSISIITGIGFLFVLSFYARLSVKIASFMCVILIFFIITNAWINTLMQNSAIYFYLIVFTLSWIFQFIGHKIEGKKPSFLKDLQFLLIGPIWLLHFILQKFEIKY